MSKPRKRVKAVMRKTADVVDITPSLGREYYRMQTVERLKEALCQAESGNLISVAIVGVRPGGAVTTAWGGITLLQHRISKSVNE